MNKYLKIVPILSILIVVVVVSDYFATQNSPFPPTSIFELRRFPILPNVEDRGFFFMGDIEIYYHIKTVVSSVNATLLIILLATYVDLYRKIKSEFTIGLLLFSLVLLFYALSSNPLLQWLFGFRAFGLGPFAMLPDIFTTLALAILLYLTMK